jgi:hypothetical protein
MPKFLEDLAQVFPGFPHLWNDFCYHEGEASQSYEAKLNDDVRYLDREWRKLVFRLCDYMLLALRLSERGFHADRRRLATIVHPVS